MSDQSRTDLTDDQKEAIRRLDGNVFVAAGAGSGKTGVLTARFLHAIVMDKADVDQILTITFTKKAAAEMMRRIRRSLRDGDTLVDDPSAGQLVRMAEAYRNIERAQISTIDGFYTSILRANALAAGIDPDFAVLDEGGAAVIREEVFDTCLRQLVEEESDAAEFITAYDPDLDGTLFNIVSSAYDTLRSQGRATRLPRPTVPDVAPAEKELRRSMRVARDAFGHLVKTTKTQNDFMHRLTDFELKLDAGDLHECVGCVGAGTFKPGGAGKIRAELEEVAEARTEYVKAARACLAEQTLTLIDRLLTRFDRLYSDEKHRRGVLDFADLSIHTRDLLKDNADIRARVAGRYKLIMMDEFQDTNPLQLEITSLISRDNLFLVGDENQAIYGFRYAEVALFREKKGEAENRGELITLKENFRSQAEILDFVDLVFNQDDMLAPEYLELKASAEAEEPEDFRVEVLFVDKKPNGVNVDADTCRQAEAWMIAQRLNDMKKTYPPGAVAILMRSRSSADVYRDALTAAGIDSYFAVGNTYFSRLEMSDVINMLKIIVNPLDDLAMLGVLRSPLAGLDDDSLYRLRNHEDDSEGQSRGPLWNMITEAGVREHLADEEQAKLENFIAGFNELREGAGRISLARICRRIVDFNDYAAAIASGKDGEQQLANLLKLIDIAVDFEASWGNDIAEFTEFLDHQKTVRATEGEAPTAGEELDAVRIMTMHKAKGLEFPLVVLPNLQSDSKPPGKRPALLLDRSGAERVGLDYLSGKGGEGLCFDYEELKEENRQREYEELKRLGYVAMTRAEKHLILSGSADIDKLPAPSEGRRPFGWIRNRLGLVRERKSIMEGFEVIEATPKVTVGMRVCATPEETAADFAEATGRRSAEAPESLNPAVNEQLPPAIYVPAAISPTSLDTYDACPQRYFIENVLYAGKLFEKRGGDIAATGEASDTEAVEGTLSAIEMGTLVHAILETDLPEADASEIDPRLIDERAAESLGSDVELSDADRSRAGALVLNLTKAPVAGELHEAAAAGILRREFFFSTLVGQTILQGQIDALIQDERGSIVVDYKTAKPPEEAGEGKSKGEDQDRDESKATGTYRYQLASYALAAYRLRPGPVRVVLVYLGGDGPTEIERLFTEADIASLEGELGQIIDRMADGIFPPPDERNEGYCWWCTGGPNGAAICRPS